MEVIFLVVEEWARTTSTTTQVRPKLRSITLVATEVYVILQSFVVLTWMRDTIDLV